MMKSFGRVAGALALTALCASYVLAQQIPQQPKPVGAKAAQPGAATSPPNQPANRGAVPRTVNKPVVDHSPAQLDQMIAGMLALCNEEEAMVGKFAVDHAKHEDVKSFATMMAKEHSDMAKQLQKWAPEATLMGHENQPAATSKTKESNTSFDPMHVHQQIASRSLASTEKSLMAKKGTDFDMAYIGSQCVVHQQMIDKASVLRQYASPELQAAIDQGIQSAESHLAQTHQIIEKLAQAEKSPKTNE